MCVHIEAMYVYFLIEQVSLNNFWWLKRYDHISDQMSFSDNKLSTIFHND